MATSGEAFGAFSGRSSFRVRVAVERAAVDASTNSSRWDWSIRVDNTTGSSATWSGGSGTYKVVINGVTVASGTASPFDFRDGASFHTIETGTLWIQHSPDGSKSFGISGSVTSSTIFGSASASGTVVSDVIPHPAPSGLTVSRVSDSHMSLSWSLSSSYSSVLVQRRTDGGSWQQVGAPSGSATAFSDATTTGNHHYEYRVAGKAGNATSPWSSVVSVYTTPSVPSAPSAVRDGSDIVVSGSFSSVATGVDVRDGSTVVASNVGLPWRDVSPSPSVPHTYTVRAVRGSLASAWSSPSNTVQLISPPNAPVGLVPNGAVVASDADVVFTWVHSPVDSSPQSAFELQWRPVGGSWTVVAGSTASTVSVTLPAGSFEWQVRTKGAHPDWSPWSSTATVDVVDRPGVAVLSPDGSWDSSVLVAEWSFFQGQSRPQSSWEARLLDASSVVVESRSGSGAASEVTFSRRLSEGAWTVEVRAATGGVWSDWASEFFTVTFDPPAHPSLSGVWDEAQGGVALTVGTGDPTGAVTDRTNFVIDPRTWGSGWGATRASKTVDGTVLTLTVTEVGSYPRVVSAPIAVAPGEVWSVAVQMEQEGGTHVLAVQFMTSGDVVVGTPLHGEVSATGVVGQRLTTTVMVPATAAKMFVWVGMPTGSPISTSARFREPLAERSVAPGVYFDGSTPVVTVDGVERGTQWDGAPNASTSSTIPLPVTTRLVVERSLDGDVWEDVLDSPGAVSLMDWESWSYGDVLYRVTAYTAEGAATSTSVTVQARSTAFWLSGGPGFGATCRLPHNPHVEVTAGRARDVKQYAGRSYPVVLVGESVSRVVSVSGLTADHSLGGEDTASPGELTEIAQSTGRRHLFRDPDGHRIYGALSAIQMPRDGVTAHPDGWNGLWGYSFTLTEAD